MGDRLCACGCGASLTGLRADAVYASESCSKRARRAASPDKGRTGEPTDGERLLIALRARGPVGLHSHEVRKLGISGNPSQRVAELEAEGHQIKHKREHKGRRPGCRYILKALAGREAGDPGGPNAGLSSGETPATPDRVTSSGPDTGAESSPVDSAPVPLFDLAAGNYRDPDQRAA